MNAIIKIIIVLLFAAAAPAEASGVKVNPPKLDITTRLNESAVREITVANPTSDVQLFKVYPDDFADFIRVTPSSFTLEAGAEKNVTIEIETRSDQNSSATLSTNLSVVAKPLAETQFAMNAGLKIPLSITVSENGSSGQIPDRIYYAAVPAALIAIAAFVYFLRRRNKKPA